MLDDAAPVAVSVVAAAHNEQDNVAPLVDQIAAALDPTGVQYEVLVVDDASTDETLERLRSLQASQGRLRVISLRDPAPRPGRGHGQSAAFGAGIRASRGALVVMIDADLQNDPADIPRLLQVVQETGADVVQGDRRAARRDGLVRKVSSAVGRITRRWLLGDRVADTGCSLRVVRREAAERLPLQFAGMHRFIPVMCRHLGYRVIERPVSHRPRPAGRSKYGIRNRAIPGLVDCLAVRWMRGRRRSLRYEEIGPGHRAAARCRPQHEATA